MKAEKLDKLVGLAGNYWSHAVVVASGLAGGVAGLELGRNIMGKNAPAYTLMFMAGAMLGAYVSMGALYCLSELHSVVERKIERRAKSSVKSVEDIAV